MARLNSGPRAPPRSLLPKRETKKMTPSQEEKEEEGEDPESNNDQPLEPLHRSSSPAPPSLSIEIQSKLDLNKMFNGTDITQFLTASDLDQTLNLGHQIVLQRSQVADAVNTQCAWDISMVWKSIDKVRAQRPEKSAIIQKWQEDLSQEVKKHSRDITYYLGLAEKTLKQLSSYERRIYDHWGVLPTQVLAKEKYNTDRPLSKVLLQSLAELAGHVTLDNGQRLLSESIEKRNNKETRSTWDRHEPYLLPSDVRAVIKTQQPEKKRTRVEEEDGADGTARAGVKSSKRQKTKVDTKDQDTHYGHSTNAEERLPLLGDVPGNPPSRSSPTPPSPPPGKVGEEGAAREAAESPSSPDIIKKGGKAAEELTEPLWTPKITKGGGEAAEEAAEPRSTPHVIQVEGNDGDEGPDFSDMSVEKPRKAPTPTSDYESPSSPLLLVDPETPEISPKPPASQSPSRSASLSPLPPLRTGRPSEARQHGVSADDFHEALTTLHSGGKLSSTVIQETLAFCAPPCCHIIDPLYFNSAFPNRSGLNRRLAGSVKRILIPLHNLRLVHWTLAVLNLDDNSILIYEPLARNRRVNTTLAERLKNFAKGVTRTPQRWTVQVAECPTQSNGTDCGVHVIANALFIMTNNDLPTTHDCDAWRLICRFLLGEGTRNIPFDGLEHFQSPASTEYADEAAGVKSFELPNPDHSTVTVDLRENIQLAQQAFGQVQAQQRKLQSLHDYASAIVNVVKAVRQRLSLETLALSDQLLKDEKLLAEHAALIQRYDEPACDPSGQDDCSMLRAAPASTELLSTLRATQETMTIQVQKGVTKKKAMHASSITSKGLETLAQQIKARYEDQWSLSNKAAKQTRETVQRWREVVVGMLEGLDTTLAS